jgi:hypothetical protein
MHTGLVHIHPYFHFSFFLLHTFLYPGLEGFVMLLLQSRAMCP